MRKEQEVMAMTLIMRKMCVRPEGTAEKEGSVSETAFFGLLELWMLTMTVVV